MGKSCVTYLFTCNESSFSRVRVESESPACLESSLSLNGQDSSLSPGVCGQGHRVKIRAPGQNGHGPSHIEQSRTKYNVDCGPYRAPKSRRAPAGPLKVAGPLGICPPCPLLSAGLFVARVRIRVIRSGNFTALVQGIFHSDEMF